MTSEWKLIFIFVTEPYKLCIAPCICLDFSKLGSQCNNALWICYISALQGFKGQGVRWRCPLSSCNPSSMRERLSYRSRIQREAESRESDDGPSSKTGRRCGEKVGERERRFSCQLITTNAVLVPCYCNVWDSYLGCGAEGLSWFFSVRDDKLHVHSIWFSDIGNMRLISCVRISA
jgi:hypothetical protein